MNRKGYLVIITLLTLDISFTQEKLDNFSLTPDSFYFGASLPQGDFLSTSSKKAGYSKNGVCLMIEKSWLLSQNTFLSSSLLLSVNSFNGQKLEEIIEKGFSQFEQVNKLLQDLSVSTEDYINIWHMTGPKYIIPISEKLKLYCIGQVGILVSFYPEITITLEDKKGIRQPIIIYTNTEMALAYSFGFGIQFDEVKIAFMYNISELNYNHTVISEYESISGVVKKPVLTFQIMFGK